MWVFFWLLAQLPRCLIVWFWMRPIVELLYGPLEKRQVALFSSDGGGSGVGPGFHIMLQPTLPPWRCSEPLFPKRQEKCHTRNYMATRRAREVVYRGLVASSSVIGPFRRLVPVGCPVFSANYVYVNCADDSCRGWECVRKFPKCPQHLSLFGVNSDIFTSYLGQHNSKI